MIQEMLEESRGEHEALVARREKLKAQKFKELAHLRASLQKALPREGSEGRGGGTEPNRAKIEATLKKIYGVEDELGELVVTPAFEPDPQLVEEDALLRDTRYSDEEEEEKDEEDYQPFNYSKKYRGTVTLKESLCDSLKSGGGHPATSTHRITAATEGVGGRRQPARLLLERGGGGTIWCADSALGFPFT